jgi:Zn-dependent peptidase ImmA (M78 family)/DNA-binding XRE family transcriptional regulator
MKQVNAAMISLAREARSFYQHELATLIGIAATTQNKLEIGELSISNEVIQKTSTALKFPIDFFYQSGNIQLPNLFYRKRDKVAQKLLSPIEAWANIYQLNIHKLFTDCKIEPANLPIFEIGKDGTPQQIALKVRKIWKVESGVIENLTELLERNNIPVITFNFNTERVDGRSILTENKHPIIFVNKSNLGDRQRFTLAYELGHLVMHVFNTPSFDTDISHEANLFAAEFLMPENDFTPDINFEKLSLNRLAELKKKWKVSMHSILYRANNIGAITDNQTRYTLEQFNKMKIRKREPQELDIPKEYPELIKKMMTKYKVAQKLNNEKLAAYFYLHEAEFIERYT